MYEQHFTIDEIREKEINDDYNPSRDHSRFSPIISPINELEEAADEAIKIIEKNNRKTISFSKYISENDIDYIPQCVSNDDMVLDTKTGSKQTGKLTYDIYKGVLETKRICADCPLKQQCLAVSMTEPRRTRTSKNEKSIPGTDDTSPLIMSEYMIFGGYTPQERKIIYDIICYKLEEKDKNKEKYYHYDYENIL